MQKQQIRRQLAGQRSSKELHNIYIYIAISYAAKALRAARTIRLTDGSGTGRKKHKEKREYEEQNSGMALAGLHADWTPSHAGAGGTGAVEPDGGIV